MVEIDVLYDIWNVCLEYIPAKDKAAVADHIVSNLIDAGINDSDFRDFCSRDRYLREAAKSYDLEFNDEYEEN